MRYLLDTHVLIWALAAPQRLSATARAILSEPTSQLYVSIVSALELSILEGLGRVQLGAPVDVVFSERIAAMRIRLVAMQLHHLALLARLPSDHRDPFDRLLIATAMADGFSLISGDGRFTRYGLDVVW